MSPLRQYAYLKNGATLIELIVAIVMMSIFVPVVYTCWTMINNHILTQQRKTALRKECGRIAETVGGDIRRSDAILNWDRNSIHLISNNYNDTVRYSFDGSTLTRNGNAFESIIRGAKISNFAIENQNEENEFSPYLFRIEVTLVNVSGDSVSVSTAVAANRLNQQRPDNDFLW